MPSTGAGSNVKLAWLLVIDTGSNPVAGTIPGPCGSLALAVTPDGRHIYLDNYCYDSVSVIETGV
jgi:DNA-binding beta-propeller fold protein YncE